MNTLSEQTDRSSILIIEDDATIAMYERTVLERYGYCITRIVGRSEDAVASVNAETPDLILMDIFLDGNIDGIDTAIEIHKSHDIPVIFLSAIEDNANIDRIKESGAYGFLCKPVREYELIAAIEAAVARHKLEKRSRYNEQKYRFIFENMQDVYFELSTDGNLIEISPSVKNLLGYDRKEIKGSHCSIFLDGEGFLETFLSRLLHRQGSIFHDVALVRKSREHVVCDIRAVLALDKNNNPVKIVGSITDISSRKEMEKKIVAAHSEVQSILMSLSSILIGVSIKDTITHWNKEAQKVFNISPETILGERLTHSGLNWEWNRIYEGIAFAITDNKAVILNELRYSLKKDNDQNRFLNIKITPVKDVFDKLSGFLLSGEDITEKRSMRIRMNQSQKMEAIGQLAAGMAHEINTPTQYINDNTIFVRDSFTELIPILSECHHLSSSSSDEAEGVKKLSALSKKIDLPFLIDEIPVALSQTLEGIGRIAKIVGSMKQFSHPGTQEKIPYDINRIIDDTVTISRNEWKYTAELTTDLDSSIPLIKCFPNELGQVLLNMIINAVQAIDAKTGKNPEVKGLISISSRLEGSSVVIDIRDTGMGISEDVKYKIFDPFFTTKEVGKGTGQGLAISHTVIYDMHGGEISVSSEIGTGTVFTITLPVDDVESAEDKNEF